MRDGWGLQRVGERTFAGTRGNGEVAPQAVIRVIAIKPRGSTRKRTLGAAATIKNPQCRARRTPNCNRSSPMMSQPDPLIAS